MLEEKFITNFGKLMKIGNLKYSYDFIAALVVSHQASGVKESFRVTFNTISLSN